MQGPIEKMHTHWNSPIEYFLPLGKELLELNPLIGKPIAIKWLNKIICMHCGKPTKKSFGQGYCYPCFISIPETEACVLNPEKCQAHLGIARDMEWATRHCLQDHFVYLALTSDIKVGVTRQSQVPTRWIDQGAWKVIKLARTPNRFLAGLIEVELKKIMPDKTNWRNMLKNILDYSKDLLAVKQEIGKKLDNDLVQYFSEENEITEIEYPVQNYPLKPESIDLEKLNSVSGTLTGIKGQYLIFDSGKCLNVRKHGGFVVEVEY
jgi:hypothetical protein